MRFQPVFCGFFVAFLSFRCADKIVSECSIMPGKKATFQNIQKDVFTPKCARTGCHAGSEPAASLNLEAIQSYANLINVASVQIPSRKRVLPGHSDQSYLLDKLTQTDLSIMPPEGKLENAVVDSIAAWIDRGAIK